MTTVAITIVAATRIPEKLRFVGCSNALGSNRKAPPTNSMITIAAVTAIGLVTQEVV